MMNARTKACFVEDFHSIEVTDAVVIVTADCLHVSGSIRESSAVDIENSQKTVAA